MHVHVVTSKQNKYHFCVKGLFQPTHYTYNGETNAYVDGGLICNYPIHCYDGKSVYVNGKTVI